MAVLTTEDERLARDLRALAVQLTLRDQRERMRLAGILHDHLQQLIVAARMRVEAMGRTGAEGYREVCAILDEAIREARSLAAELGPAALQQHGLCGGLRSLAGLMSRSGAFAVHLTGEETDVPVTEDMRLLVFDCVRELLLNASRHSGAPSAEVTVSVATDGFVEVEVRDGGRGFDLDAVRERRAGGGSGLFGVEQRLVPAGGSLRVISTPGRGTIATVRVPVAAASDTPGRSGQGDQPTYSTAGEPCDSRTA